MNYKPCLFWVLPLMFAGMLSLDVSAERLADYSVAQLLEPCVEGDNDSRWGEVAESECEQYITGFTDAYVLLTQGGKKSGVCLPASNRPDEVRWAFMKWAHKHYDQRGMPAGKGLLDVIKAEFPCK